MMRIPTSLLFGDQRSGVTADVGQVGQMSEILYTPWQGQSNNYAMGLSVISLKIQGLRALFLSSVIVEETMSSRVCAPFPSVTTLAE